MILLLRKNVLTWQHLIVPRSILLCPLILFQCRSSFINVWTTFHHTSFSCCHICSISVWITIVDSYCFRFIFMNFVQNFMQLSLLREWNHVLSWLFCFNWLLSNVACNWSVRISTSRYHIQLRLFRSLVRSHFVWNVTAGYRIRCLFWCYYLRTFFRF